MKGISRDLNESHRPTNPTCYTTFLLHTTGDSLDVLFSGPVRRVRVRSRGKIAVSTGLVPSMGCHWR